MGTRPSVERVHRLALRKLPAVAAVERTATPKERSEAGVAFGTNAKGDRVRFDVARGTITRNHDAPFTLAGAQDPLTPGLVAVDDEGRRALLLASRSLHADPALVLVDLELRASESVRSFDGPGWLVGGFAGAQIVVCEQRLGDKPRFSITVNGRSAWSVEGMQQPCVPVRVREDVIALLLCLAPEAVTGTGPSALVAVDLASGAVSLLAPAEGTRVRLEESAAARALIVEGGSERVRVVLAD